MKSSKSILILSLAISAAVLAANTASAGGFNFGGGGGGGGGGVKFSLSSGHHHHGHHHHAHHNHHHHHKSYHHVPVKRYYVQPALVYSRCYHPPVRFCYVYPGDTWLTICQRAYGCTYLWKHIASYNGLPISAPLFPGQQLQLPVINTDGSLAASSAPAPAPFAPQGVPFGTQGVQLGPQGVPFGAQSGQLAPQGQPVGPQGLPMSPNGGSPAPQIESAAPSIQPSAPTTPAASIRSISAEPSRPTVAIGSVLMLEGESLGDEKGIVRLRINNMSLPVEVIEWSASAAKIQLPKMDLTGSIKADLEVLRADGSLASKTAINLTPAATRLALGN